MKLAWLTDIHLNFLRDEAEEFIKSLAGTEADAFLIGGDIGEAHDIRRHLNAMDNFRKAVLNALVWLCKLDVPKDGVQSAVTDEEIRQNLDPKPQKK